MPNLATNSVNWMLDVNATDSPAGKPGMGFPSGYLFNGRCAQSIMAVMGRFDAAGRFSSIDGFRYAQRLSLSQRISANSCLDISKVEVALTTQPDLTYQVASRLALEAGDENHADNIFRL